MSNVIKNYPPPLVNCVQLVICLVYATKHYYTYYKITP